MRLLALITTGALLLAACGGDGESTLVVSAASSLTESVTEIADAFEATNEGVAVELNFASSSSLATQIIEGGAPVDVFASANEAQMQLVIDAGDASAASIFAANRLVIVAPAESAVASFEDLAAPGVRLVLAAPDVPVGAYAREVLVSAAASGRYDPDFADTVLANLVSEEANVRQVLTKVELGEADAGIVYATDAVVSGERVRMIPVPEELAPLAAYPIATLTEGDHPELASAFVDFVLSAEGRGILEAHGFLVP